MGIEHFTKVEWARGRLRGALLGALGIVVVASCGGGTPPPATPEPTPQASAIPAASGSPAAEQTAEPPKSAQPEAAPAAKQDIMLEKPTRPVRSILESADSVYFVSYGESDVGKTAEGNCAKESGGDPQKNSACMAKARQGLEGLGYRFKKNPKDE